MLKELITRSRSYRRFHEDVAIDRSQLVDLIDLARLGPSAANLQPLKYYLSADAAANAKIFPHLAWAGYLKDWPGPNEGERPTGYIVILGDQNIARNYNSDHGIAAQSMMLGAAEQGLGGCIIATIKRHDLARALELADHLEILWVLALGKPREEVVLETMRDGDFHYWRDDKQVHHVPKRTLDELIVGGRQGARE